MKKEIRSRRPGILLLMLAVSGVLMAAAGLILRHEVGKAIESYRDKPAIAVPFLLLSSDIDVHIWRESMASALVQTLPPVAEAPTAPDTQPATEPSTEPLTEPPTEPSTEPAPVAVYGQDESWFDDALFIGDSRMQGISQYARLGKADYFVEVGLNVFSLFSTSVSDMNFDSLDLSTLLQRRAYGKIYIMLGLNESGYGYDSLMNQYAQVLDRIRKAQPEARIYLLKVYGVSRSKAASQSSFSPENLTKINNGIEAMEDHKQIFCLDPRPLFEDSEGYILAEVSGDGVHPYGKYAGIFSEWLCQQPEP